MPCRFYEQVTYEAYIFVDTNVIVPAEGCTYVIFHEPTERSFRYNTTINQHKRP